MQRRNRGDECSKKTVCKEHEFVVWNATRVLTKSLSGKAPSAPTKKRPKNKGTRVYNTRVRCLTHFVFNLRSTKKKPSPPFLCNFQTYFGIKLMIRFVHIVDLVNLINFVKYKVDQIPNDTSSAQT